jgi:hypothetical protein
MLEDIDNLQASLPKIKAILVSLLGIKSMDKLQITLCLLFNQWFSMIGLPKQHEMEGKMNVKSEIRKIFARGDCIDPFVYTRYVISQNSYKIQMDTLAKEIIQLTGMVKNKYLSWLFRFRR